MLSHPPYARKADLFYVENQASWGKFEDLIKTPHPWSFETVQSENNATEKGEGRVSIGRSLHAYESQTM